MKISRGTWIIVCLLFFSVLTALYDKEIKTFYTDTELSVNNLAYISSEYYSTENEIKNREATDNSTLNSDHDLKRAGAESSHNKINENNDASSQLAAHTDPNADFQADVQDESTDGITILTFNIRSANDEKGKVELEQIISEIEEVDADIIGLQEVERLMPRSNFKDQSKEIARALGYNYVYGSNINILGARYGNATLSRYPIVSSKNHKLPHILLEPRGLLETVIDIDGETYHVFNTHLGLDLEERREQIGYINQVVGKKEANVILMGDFNYSSKDLNMIDPELTDSAVALDRENDFTYSYHSSKPNVRIDRIYVSSDIELLGHQVLSSVISDHLRVITYINKK